MQYLSIIAGLTKNVGLMNIMKEVYIKTNQAAANVTGSVTKQFLIPFIFICHKIKLIFLKFCFLVCISNTEKLLFWLYLI